METTLTHQPDLSEIVRRYQYDPVLASFRNLIAAVIETSAPKYLLYQEMLVRIHDPETQDKINEMQKHMSKHILETYPQLVKQNACSSLF